MEGNFRTLFRKFCLESTVLGLKYFYLYPDFLSRCFWLVNLGAVLFLATLLTGLLYQRFAESPTRVTIDSQYEPVQNLPFPAVTLCSPNQITASFTAHFNRTLVDGNMDMNLAKMLPNLLGFYGYVTDYNVEDIAQLQSLLDLNRYTVTDVMAAIPQSCDDFLKKCSFNSMTYPNCSAIFQPIFTVFGFCCGFNSIYHYHDKRNIEKHDFEVEYVGASGRHNGLTVVTDYNPDDAIEGSILDSGAVKVLYNDYSEFPKYAEFMVESNVALYSAFEAVYTYCSDDVKALPPSSRNCYLGNEHDLPYFNRYRNSDCNMVCYAKAVKDACNCTLFFLPGLKPTDNICNLTKLSCITGVKVNMSNWLSKWKCDCPQDCEYRRYDVVMNIANLKALPYMVVNPFEGITFNDSTTIMHFFFYNSYVKQKQETVMSLITLASNLGGVYGLCLGCSGISVLEVIFYLITAIKNHIKRKIRRTEIRKNIVKT